METNQAIPSKDGKFTAHLRTPSGSLRLVPGFGSEHEALAWMVQATKLLYASDRRLTVPTRDTGKR
jgi:hypothetical protein